jgi:cobalt-zinc-cadmium efflux system membrane fusion protein
MPVKGARLGIVAAVLLAAGGGYFIARAFDPHDAVKAPEEHAEEGHAEEGEHAEGFVALKPADAPAAGVELSRVERGGGPDLLLPGRVAVALNAQSTVGSPLDGTVVRMHVAPGQHVLRGGAVASIRSPDGGAIRAEVDTARASLEAAEALSERNQRLFNEGVIARQEWETTRAATLSAQAQVRAAESQAAAMSSPDAGGLTVIRSPIAGIVMRVSAAPGAVLDEGMEIAIVADTSRTELVFDAPPASIGLIVPGARMEARWTGGQTFEAEIIGAAPAAAGATGGIVRAKPLSAAPPPGTVISGRLTGGDGNIPTVPSEAVQTVEGAPSVFIVEEEGFRVRVIVPGRTSNGRTEIVSGLTGEEQIAGRGAFLLKAELGKGDAEHDH